jgi:hypothetical protein
MFVKIEDFEEEKIWSGTIIRIHLEHQSEFYYTDKVFDIIVFENYTEEMGLGAMQISGYKAGKINLFFPKESYFDESFYTIKSVWIRDNLLQALNITPENAQIYINKFHNIIPF